MGKINDPAKAVIPTTGGNFIKLAAGSNRFRIIEVFAYYKGWLETEDTKLSYIADDTGNQEADQQDLIELGCSKITHNWGMLVLDRMTGVAGILDIHQKSIKEPIRGLWNDEEWGHPNQYDIVIEKTGSGMKGTKYRVTPQPKRELTQEEITLIEESGINLSDTFDPKRYNVKDDEADEKFETARSHFASSTYKDNVSKTADALGVIHPDEPAEEPQDKTLPWEGEEKKAF